MFDDDEGRLRHQIVAAHLQLVAVEGFDVSYERIATVAGVPLTTVSEIFPTHEVLNTATIGELFDHYDYSLDNAPALSGDVGAWIDSLCEYVHKDNAELFGQGFWDLALSATKLTGGLVDLVSDRRWLRGRWSRVFAERAWHASGRTDDPPAVLRQAFDVHLTAFATNALLAIGYSIDEVASTTAGLLKAVLAGAIE